MNPILMANMQAIMNQTPREPKPERGARLHNNSKSAKIIKYLFENGKSSGAEIMLALDLTNSPKSYIQPHVRAGRVICDSVHIHKAMYSINSQLKLKDFGVINRGEVSE
jgi:hypothetical protein